MNERRMKLRPSALVSAPVILFSFMWAVIAHFADIVPSVSR